MTKTVLNDHFSTLEVLSELDSEESSVEPFSSPAAFPVWISARI